MRRERPGALPRDEREIPSEPLSAELARGGAMVHRSLLGLIFVSLTVGCSPSSATFVTRYPTTDALDSSIARGAARAGCRAETSFRGPQIVCPDAKSVQLKSRDGFYEAECSGMSRGECEQFLEEVVGATAGG